MGKAEETRQKMLTIASKMFLEMEYDQVRFSDIAKRASMSQGSFYDHFKDKEELYLACCDRAFQEASAIIDQMINPNASARERLSQCLRANMFLATKRSELIVPLCSTLYLSVFRKKFGEIQRSFHEASRRRYETILSHGNHEKCWKISHPSRAARSLHSLILGEVFKVLVFPDEFSLTKRVDLLTESSERLLGIR